MDEAFQDPASPGPLERVTAVAQLLLTLDRRVLDAFDALTRIGAASSGLERLSEDGDDLVADLRTRLDRMEERLYADLDEVKTAALAKLRDLDPEEIRSRFAVMESSLQTIERAVTRVDGIVEGLVDTVPEFITRRVRAKADRIEDEVAE